MAKDTWKLVPVETRPFNAETPMQALTESLTSTPLFYVRNYFDVPGLGAASWRLTIDGVVEHPLGFSAKDLQTLPERMAIVTLDSAGNGRTRRTRRNMGYCPTPQNGPPSLAAVE